MSQGSNSPNNKRTFLLILLLLAVGTWVIASSAAPTAAEERAGQLALAEESFEMINDGSFEEWPTEWDLTKSPGASCYDSKIDIWTTAKDAYHSYRAGGFCLLATGVTPVDYDYGWQRIKVPNNKTTLSFWYYAQGRSEMENPSGDDYAYVKVNNKEVWRLVMNSQNDTSDWVEARVDLSANAGQSVLFTIGADQGADKDFGDVYFDYFGFINPDVITCDQISQIPQSECEALQALYSSTNIAQKSWKWFKTTTPCDDWFNVVCDGGHVAELLLGHENLSGVIPAKIGQLGRLKILDLEYNDLSGHIPSKIGNLGELHTLNLDNNRLDGQIPDWSGTQLSKLVTLDLRENQLSGEIPQLLSLSSLETINLQANQLTGNIPEDWRYLSNLKRIWVNINPLSGRLPDRLQEMGSRLLIFHYNETDLCEPPDPDFQQWLVAIPDRIGTGVSCCTIPLPAFQISPDRDAFTLNKRPTFTWQASANATGSTKYRIEVAQDLDFNQILFQEALTGLQTTPGSSLNEGSYYWRVRAENMSGSCNEQSSWSERRKFTIGPPIIEASDGSYEDKVLITWNSVSAATAYKVYRTSTPNGVYAHLGDSSTTSYEDKSAQPGATYYYQVKACNNQGCSSFSAKDSGYRQEKTLVELKGYTNCPWGGDCNQCVNDVKGSFLRINQTGDPNGFHMGNYPDVIFERENCIKEDWIENDDECQHWQGIQRLSIGDGRYLVVSHNNMKDDDDGEHASGLAIVYMGSRNPIGFSFYSNLGPAVGWPPSLGYIPDKKDVIVAKEVIDKDEDHHHPGGIQAMGNYLAVGTGSRIHFYDMSNPENPKQLSSFMHNLGQSFSSSALAKLKNHKYLLVTTATDAKPMSFYISNTTTSVTNGFTKFYTWPADDEDQKMMEKWPAFQSMNLVTECGSGKLYLVGTHQRGKATHGPDIVSLYQIYNSDGKVKILEHAHLELNCNFAGVNYCNFDAAGGVYVDKDNMMYIYATNWENEGFDNTVRFKEFWEGGGHTPTILLNYDTGGLGSWIYGSGSNFIPSSLVNVLINNVPVIKDLPVNVEGAFDILLDTKSVSTFGDLVISVVTFPLATNEAGDGGENLLAGTVFTLEPGAPVREKEGDAPEYKIPPGIPITHLRLPLVIR